MRSKHHGKQLGAHTEVQAEEAIYSIGEAARMIGSTIKTVRYYDEVGLVKPACYTEGGHRLYSTEDLWRLELITTLRYLDFGIDEIRHLISGELSVDKALDWQIDSLETQANTLTNMIAILREAKQHQGDSLRYIHKLVNERTINSEKRKQFIADKVETTRVLDGIPEEWRDSLLYFFDKYIINQVKASAKQADAWNELQKLINDPQFIEDIRNHQFLFFNMVVQPPFKAGLWVKKLEHIHNRLNKALKQKLPPRSPYVQAIVEDTAMLYTNVEQSANKEDFFRYFAEHSQSALTERMERFDTLCSIISPTFLQFSKGNVLLHQAIRWKLQQM
ncbi:MerR family transcriptional regulator [Paenibacillus sp. NPDC057967]|uniref:MerR family transcriptional regulator n=1 Tax=Paenibacillus sp. NPDC057967 TaxID=3346293 RepID=UPI0036DDAB28